MEIDPAHQQEIADARLLAEILDDWGKLDPKLRQGHLADLGIERLDIETILLLPRPQREQLFLAIQRHLARQDAPTDAPGVGADLTEFDKYRGRPTVTWYPENAYGYGGMGFWPERRA